MKVAQELIHRRATVAVAESCTGGLLAHRLTNIPGSSRFFQLGIVAYSNEVKQRLLKVPAALLQKHGAVSPQVAIAMAEGIRKSQKTDFGIGITGIAGPDGGTKRKPIGLTYIAIKTKDETLCATCQFPGERASIKTQAATQALHLLLEFLV